MTMCIPHTTLIVTILCAWTLSTKAKISSDNNDNFLTNSLQQSPEFANYKLLATLDQDGLLDTRMLRSGKKTDQLHDPPLPLFTSRRFGKRVQQPVNDKSGRSVFVRNQNERELNMAIWCAITRCKNFTFNAIPFNMDSTQLGARFQELRTGQD